VSGTNYEKEAREMFEAAPERRQRSLLDVAIRTLESFGVDDPPPELVEEIALKCCQRMLEDTGARMKEFLTDELLGHYCPEEMRRLEPRYPDGVPEDVLTEAVLQRARADFPEAFEPPSRRRG
jgi:hypothetical protein